MSTYKSIASVVLIVSLLYMAHLIAKYRNKMSKSDDMHKVVISLLALVFAAVYNFAISPKTPQILPVQGATVTITSSENGRVSNAVDKYIL